MKVDFSDKSHVAEVRSKLSSKSDLKAFDSFVAEVKVFDMNNDEHIAKAKKCCQNCCQTVTIHTEIH